MRWSEDQKQAIEREICRNKNSAQEANTKLTRLVGILTNMETALRKSDTELKKLTKKFDQTESELHKCEVEIDLLQNVRGDITETIFDEDRRRKTSLKKLIFGQPAYRG